MQDYYQKNQDFSCTNGNNIGRNKSSERNSKNRKEIAWKEAYFVIERMRVVKRWWGIGIGS